MSKQRLCLATLALACAATASVVTGQQAQVTDPVFTAQQAADGRPAYDATCAMCHRANLAGAFEAPQLTGGNFLSL